MPNIERPYTGLTAEVKINNVLMGYMSGIDLTIEKSMIDILQFGSKYSDKVPAQRSWSATVDGTLAIAPGSSQSKLWDAFDNDEKITVGIFLDDNTYFEGDAYIGNLNINTAPDDKTSISCDLEGAGGLNLTVNLTYSVTVSSGVGGTVTPGGTQVVKSGSPVSYKITPATGYIVDKVMDGTNDITSTASSGEFTISNITADHKIVVTFKAAND